MKSRNEVLGKRFQQAFELAFELHADQKRKGTSIPYIAHLMAVTGLVIENGGDEDTAVAALLHDAVEDQGGLEILGMIRNRFGEKVAKIVLDCSDSVATPKPPWHQRKEVYLVHLETISSDSLLVSLADKLHNARSILTDLEQLGPVVWERFNGGREGTLWYYRSLADYFEKHNRFPALSHELGRVVSMIETLANTYE